jgi:pimeloyl-ACP methyl ester carboxylesterase
VASFIANGHRLFYVEEGRGAPLVILHGNTSSSAMHEEELEHFGKRHHAVGIDFWGTGRSERIAEWPKRWWWNAAEDAAALVRHLGEGPAVFVGTSGGGVAALLAAIHYPETVKAVIADSCVATWRPEEVDAMMAGRSRLSLGQIAFWQKAHGDGWQTVVERDTEMIRSYATTGIDFFEGRLAEIACPVLLTDSLGDEMLPRVGEEICRMTREIPDCRALIVNDGRHPMMWSRAEEFRRVSDAFLSAVEK